MSRILQSPITVAVIACLMFFLTMFLMLRSIRLGTVSAVAREPLLADDDPSWRFHNPDIDQWVAQIRSQQESLAVREQQLKDWEARLAAENREIATVTQAVNQVQADFDKRVLLFTDQQKDNVKKQLKVIGDMTPAGAVAMFNEMPDDEVAKILYALKPDISGSILDAMSKVDANSARRAAALTDKIKNILPVGATNNLAANASR